ncbi:hypothetical protein SAY87_016256 [Trapa incisa]|uniref:BRCA1-associated 2/ETP1 RRM domain-containing protein n=1 Tax=Trapa incisa TaxID=236973 RepID=A0AAN7L881_9MYRT|nr:hypothetical protein SAY87_016256 [Trapa incisa]
MYIYGITQFILGARHTVANYCDALEKFHPLPLTTGVVDSSSASSSSVPRNSLTQAVHFSSGSPRIEETRGVMHLFPEHGVSSSSSTELFNVLSAMDDSLLERHCETLSSTNLGSEIQELLSREQVGLKVSVYGLIRLEEILLSVCFGVPNHMTYADFCQFCAAFIQHIREMRIYYESLLDVKDETNREISAAVEKAITKNLQKQQTKLDICMKEKKLLNQEFISGNQGASRQFRMVKKMVSILKCMQQIGCIACVAFETARKRRGKLCSVDKANVLEMIVHIFDGWRHCRAEDIKRMILSCPMARQGHGIARGFRVNIINGTCPTYLLLWQQ